MGDEIDDQQQDNCPRESQQHGWNRDRLIDRPDMEYGAQEPTSQEGANDGHDDIDQQAPAVMHDLAIQPIIAATMR